MAVPTIGQLLLTLLLLWSLAFVATTGALVALAAITWAIPPVLLVSWLALMGAGVGVWGLFVRYGARVLGNGERPSRQWRRSRPPFRRTELQLASVPRRSDQRRAKD